jgi:hypothetical protein
MIRVKSLLDEITEKRLIRTRICSDMYWTQTTLSKIYPYTTLQFLCIQDWSSPNILDASFGTFCERLVQVYADASGSAPKLLSPRPSSPSPTTIPTIQFGYLDAMRFDPVSYDTLKREKCTNGVLITDPKYVVDGISEMNTEFQQHITSVLNIIDSLIIVLKDPDTGERVVRLSPEISSKKRPTKKSILVQRDKAISVISNHYIRIEEIYVRALRRIPANTKVDTPQGAK